MLFVHFLEIVKNTSVKSGHISTELQQHTIALPVYDKFNLGIDMLPNPNRLCIWQCFYGKSCVKFALPFH